MTSIEAFWADEIARSIISTHCNFVVATGITPSGEIHIGNMREVVTADVVVRVLKELGKEVSFCYIADTYDPLRRVYPFLCPEKYAAHVGKPLSEIPCPCDRHASYAQHYLEPFLQALKILGIGVEVFCADQLYKSGRYATNIIRALSQKNAIRKILQEETGKKLNEEWSPFNPICNHCGRMTATKVTGFDVGSETVQYICECGDKGSVSIHGGGKLTWRVDWAARWEILQITVEPFGKDHASRGGSYDTGIRISREVFGRQPPFPVVYEWISLKGAGDMSSSKGNVISIAEMIQVVPPEVLKYFITKAKPNRRIVFDPGLSFLSVMDEYEDVSSSSRNARAAQLSSITARTLVGLPFRHMISLVQTTQDDVSQIIKILHKTGHHDLEEDSVRRQATYARRWLDRFAPEEVKFVLQKTVPSETRTLSEAQRKVLGRLAAQLRCDMTAEEIHALIYEAKAEVNLSPQGVFAAIYTSLLGKDRGPRAGFFLASLDTDFVKKRFEEVSQMSTVD